MQKIALLTDSAHTLTEGEALLFQAMQSEADFQTQSLNWESVSPSAVDADVIIPRTTWGYYQHLDAFLSWIDEASGSGIQVLNSPRLIRWNTDKHYLLDLQTMGVRVAPTRIVDQKAEMTLPASDSGWVIKPSIGASSAMVERFASSDANAASAYAERILSHSAAVIQPFIPEVMAGEISYMFFNRSFSHAVKRTPHKTDFRNQPDYQGHEAVYRPSQAEIAAAQKVLDVVQEDLLYARVDTVTIDGELTVMELELVEPYLFFEFDNQSTARFIQAIRAMAL